MTPTRFKPSRVETTALVVRVGEILHALPVAAIEEVLPALPIEPAPGAPPFVRGVVFVRGHLIPVIDAALRMGLGERRRPPEPPIVCLSRAGKLWGLEVDEALDLVDWSRGVYANAGEVGVRESYLTGLVELNGQILRLLDPEKLLAVGEMDASSKPAG